MRSKRINLMNVTIAILTNLTIDAEKLDVTKSKGMMGIIFISKRLRMSRRFRAINNEFSKYHIRLSNMNVREYLHIKERIDMEFKKLDRDYNSLPSHIKQYGGKNWNKESVKMQLD